MSTLHSNTSPDASHALQSDGAALSLYARTKDPQAFALLTTRYQRMVLATCLRIVKSQADAEDAAQETFLKLARKAHEIHGNAAAWLHACAMGTSLDLLRRKGSNARAEQAARDLTQLAQGSAQDAVLWRELEPALDEALATLAPEDRDAIVAHFLAGRTQKQIADEAGVAPGTLSRRIDRGLEALATQLRTKGFGTLSIAALAATLTYGGSQAVASVVIAAAAAKAALSQAAFASPHAVTSGAGVVSTAALASKASGLSTKTVAFLAFAGLVVAGGAGALLFVNSGQQSTQSIAGAPPLLLQPTSKMPLFPMSDLREDAAIPSSTTLEITPTQIIHRTPTNWTGPQQRTVLERLDTTTDAGSTTSRVRIAEAPVDDDNPAFIVQGATGTAKATVRDGYIRVSLDLDNVADDVNEFQGRKLSETAPATSLQSDPASEVLGTWFEVPNWNLALSPDAIEFVAPNGFVAEKYRITSWQAFEGFAHIDVICTSNVMQIPMIGKRLKMILSRDGDTFQLIRHTFDSKKLDVLPVLPVKKGDGTRISVFQKEAP